MDGSLREYEEESFVQIQVTVLSPEVWLGWQLNNSLHSPILYNVFRVGYGLNLLDEVPYDICYDTINHYSEMVDNSYIYIYIYIYINNYQRNEKYIDTFVDSVRRIFAQNPNTFILVC